jgi:dUTP pyrophosphatase
MKENVIYISQHHLLQYVTKAYTGIDLRASFDVDLLIKPIGRSVIPSDIFLDIPIAYKAEISAGSQHSFKNGITIFNSPGNNKIVCRNDVCMMKMNLSEENFVIRYENRIDPMLMAKHRKVEGVIVENLVNNRIEIGRF